MIDMHRETLSEQGRKNGSRGKRINSKNTNLTKEKVKKDMSEFLRNRNVV